MQELKESSEGDSESEMLSNNIGRVLPQSKEPQSLILRKANPVLKKTESEHEGRRRFYSHTEQGCDEPGNNNKMNVPMVGNFINADLMQKGRTLDRNIEESEMVLEVWRHRIDSNLEKNSSNMIR